VDGQLFWLMDTLIDSSAWLSPRLAI